MNTVCRKLHMDSNQDAGRLEVALVFEISAPEVLKNKTLCGIDKESFSGKFESWSATHITQAIT